MHGLVEPNGFLCALWRVQAGACFHCNKLMLFTRNGRAGQPKSLLATREHIFPRATTGQNLRHNVVLAHSSCNGARGCKEPTPDEITKAKAIYMILGLTPFVPQYEWTRWPRFYADEEMLKADICGAAKRSWDNFKPPTLAEIWPVAYE